MTWTLLIVNVACTIAGFRMGRQKGHPILGLLLGLFLAIPGLIILWIVLKIMEAKARRAGEQMSAGSQRQERLAAEVVNDPPRGRHRAG